MTREHIREIRKTLGLKVTEVAQLIGYSFHTVNDWERGRLAVRPCHVRLYQEVFGPALREMKKLRKRL